MNQRNLTFYIIVYCYKNCILIYVVNCTCDELTYFYCIVRNEIFCIFGNICGYYGLVIEVIVFFYHYFFYLVTLFYFFSYFSSHGILAFTVTFFIIFFFFFINIIFIIIVNFHFIFFFNILSFIFNILILFIICIFPFFKFREIFNMQKSIFRNNFFFVIFPFFY